MEFLQKVLFSNRGAEKGRSYWTMVFAACVLVVATPTAILATAMTWTAALAIPIAAPFVALAVFSVKRIRHHELRGGLANVSMPRLLFNVVLVVVLMWALYGLRS